MSGQNGFKDNNKIRSESGTLFFKSISLPNLSIDAFKKYINYNSSTNSILYKGESFFLNFDAVKNESHEEILDFYINARDYMTEKGIIASGIKNCLPKDKKIFTDKGISVYIDNAQLQKKTLKKDTSCENSLDLLTKSLGSSKTLVFNGLLRGGDQIKNEDGDIIVIGSVNTGAEVYASGNVIILGSAEGRVVAGVKDPEAFIYAKKFKPTIISINGNYKIIEDNSCLYNSDDMIIKLKDQDLTFTLMGS